MGGDSPLNEVQNNEVGGDSPPKVPPFAESSQSGGLLPPRGAAGAWRLSLAAKHRAFGSSLQFHPIDPPLFFAPAIAPVGLAPPLLILLILLLIAIQYKEFIMSYKQS